MHSAWEFLFCRKQNKKSYFVLQNARQSGYNTLGILCKQNYGAPGPGQASEPERILSSCLKKRPKSCMLLIIPSLTR